VALVDRVAAAKAAVIVAVAEAAASKSTVRQSP